MKKIKVIALCCAMLVFSGLALGSGSDSSSEKKEIVTNDTVEKSEAGSSADNSSVKEDTAAVADSAAKVMIDEQVLFEQDGLKVTAKEYVTDSIWGDGIKLLIENNGSTDIGLGCTALIVNDYMITDLFSATVAAGKKANETLYLSSSGLKASGIENVGKIEIYFHTFDSNTYMPISKMECVTVKTSAFDKMDSVPNDAGQELYNEDGIRIVGKYVDEGSFWGAGVLLYIENNSGKNAIIQCDDMSINDFMVTPYFSATVYDGKKIIDDITLLSKELEENGITSIDEIELKFKIIDENFMNSKETETIKFSAK